MKRSGWRRRALWRGLAAACLLLLAAGVALPSRANPGSAAGDRAWEERGRDFDGERASPARIEEAVAAYRAQVRADPRSIEAHWKLLRALHFLVEFTNAEPEKKDRALEEALALTERFRGAPVRADSESEARWAFWSAIVWGAKAQRAGILNVIREGVITRIYEYAQRAAALDPSVDRGGPLRLLSRLHADVPRIPFVSGWVDRQQALALAERSYAIDAGHPGNRVVLALALLARAPERRAEARSLLEGVAERGLDPRALAEGHAIREQARRELAAMARGAG